MSKLISIPVIVLASVFLMGCGVNHSFKSSASNSLGSTGASGSGGGPTSSPPVAPPPAPTAEDCSTPQYALTTRTNNTAPMNYYFGIYAAWGGTMNVYIPAGHTSESVDLYLQSYSRVHWNISGDASAVRSVTTTGYEAASVSGVPSYKVSISTYEQNSSGYTGYKNETPGVSFRKYQSDYEGYCVSPFIAD
jgi:hypothetical protein